MLTEFGKRLVNAIPIIAGYGLGSLVGTISPGYDSAIFSLLLIPTIIFVGPRVEVWLIEIGWIK